MKTMRGVERPRMFPELSRPVRVDADPRLTWSYVTNSIFEITQMRIYANLRCSPDCHRDQINLGKVAGGFGTVGRWATFG